MPIVGSWHGEERRISLIVDTFHPLDLYREYRSWRRTDESARKWAPLLRMEGAIPKGGGKFTPRFMILLGGTKLVPQDLRHTLKITGEIITDNPELDPDIIDTSSLTSAVFTDYAPPTAEILSISTQDKEDIVDWILARVIP